MQSNNYSKKNYTINKERKSRGLSKFNIDMRTWEMHIKWIRRSQVVAIIHLLGPRSALVEPLRPHSKKMIQPSRARN